MKSFSRNEKGFTLIELLVVIAIIGILSSVIMAGLLDARHKAQGSYIEQTVGEYRNALELYLSDHGYYPTPTATPITATKCLGDYSPSGVNTNACGIVSPSMYNEDTGLASAFTGYMNGTPPVTTADVNINLGGISALWRGATYQCKNVNGANKCTKIEIDWYREDQATNCSYGATLDPTYSAYGKTFCKLTVGN